MHARDAVASATTGFQASNGWSAAMWPMKPGGAHGVAHSMAPVSMNGCEIMRAESMQSQTTKHIDVSDCIAQPATHWSCMPRDPGSSPNWFCRPTRALLCTGDSATATRMRRNRGSHIAQPIMKHVPWAPADSDHQSTVHYCVLRRIPAAINSGGIHKFLGHCEV